MAIYNVSDNKNKFASNDFHTVELPTYCADNHLQEKFHAQLFAKNKETVGFSNQSKCCCIKKPTWWYHTHPDGTRDIKWSSVAATLVLLLVLIFLIILIIVFIRFSLEISDELSKHTMETPSGESSKH